MISEIKKNIITNYIKYPKNVKYRCPACNSKIKYEHSSSGHFYQDFSGNYKDIIRLYKCLNPLCYHNKHCFNPSPSNVLPNKHYSTAVWKWIGKEAKIWGQSPIQIKERNELLPWIFSFDRQIELFNHK